MPRSPWQGLVLQVLAIVEITVCLTGSALVIEPDRVIGGAGLQVGVGVTVGVLVGGRVLVGVLVLVAVLVLVGVGVAGGQP